MVQFDRALIVEKLVARKATEVIAHPEHAAARPVRSRKLSQHASSERGQRYRLPSRNHRTCRHLPSVRIPIVDRNLHVIRQNSLALRQTRQRS